MVKKPRWEAGFQFLRLPGAQRWQGQTNGVALTQGVEYRGHPHSLLTPPPVDDA